MSRPLSTRFLDFEPLSNAFQDVGQAIRVGDLRINLIDVSHPSFLAQEDLPPVELPIQRSPREVSALREETTSSQTFEAEIDRFCFEEEEEVPERLVVLSDSEVELDRQSAAHCPRLLVAQVDANSEEEEEMALNPKRGLRDLVAGRKGASSKDAPQTQLPPLPPSPFFLLLSACTQILTCKRRKGRGRKLRRGRSSL